MNLREAAKMALDALQYPLEKAREPCEEIAKAIRSRK